MISILTPRNHHAARFESRAGVCALTVMAKAPRSGAVKTRLSPALTPGQAAQLHECFLRDTAENIASVAMDRPPNGHSAAGLVAYTPIGDEALFEGLLPVDFVMVAQRGGGFGERLLAAARDILACGYGSVCLIDSDSPTVPRAAYELAVAELARSGDRIVLGPAADGGYYLIGMKKAHATLFEQIRWSTDTVYADTLLRAHNAGIEVVDLPLWYDVDDRAALRILEEELLGGVPPGFTTLPGYAAPHSRAFLLEQNLRFIAPKNTGEDRDEGDPDNLERPRQ
jgi:rSAM/selenodomain-associated transferase 1